VPKPIDGAGCQRGGHDQGHRRRGRTEGWRETAYRLRGGEQQRSDRAEHEGGGQHRGLQSTRHAHLVAPLGIQWTWISAVRSTQKPSTTSPWRMRRKDFQRGKAINAAQASSAAAFAAPKN
jgi:hypothetical protein